MQSRCLWHFFAFALATTILGCGKPKEFEVALFCRAAEGCNANEKCATGPEQQAQLLKEMAKNGYSYVGPLNANGMNCTYVAFGK